LDLVGLFVFDRQDAGMTWENSETSNLKLLLGHITRY